MKPSPARLIAEMMSAERHGQVEDHPYRDSRYGELKRKIGFAEARVIANTEAIEWIMAQA